VSTTSSSTTQPTPEQSRLPIARRLAQRMPLHALTVAGGFASAWVLRHAPGLEPGHSAGADLLRYVPILVGLGANVGVQSSTILVRAFATGEIESERMPRVVASEIAVGVLTGTICGLACALFVGFAEGSSEHAWRLALAVGLALQLALAWAACVGCAVPLSFRRLGVDPAIAAGPALIVLSDVGAAALLVLAARSQSWLGS
jgi:magnesium transporter